ncbi:MAG: hypothetical protein FD143_2705 [Ignavibacteria bacterium]|nr:MAG: hypothetical protein FD143_2705 [Ignavibacteria bacterium]KAF0157783.1 MAG: hypothetical protein FD188_2661 [Ignavibacteria bacterium]
MRNFKLVSLILSFIFLTNISFAQTCELKCCGDTKDQIQIHLVNDYSLSYLKMLSPSSGLRFKIDLGLSGSREDKDVRSRQSMATNLNVWEPTRTAKVDDAYNSQYVNLVVNYLKAFKVEKELIVFGGIGPLISFSRNSYESISESQQPPASEVQKVKHKNNNKWFGVGLQLAVGVNVSITEKLSLLAEFNLNGTYGWETISSSNEYQSSFSSSEQTSDGTSWNYGLNQLKLGIAYSF